MINVVAIVLAVISIVGTILTAGFTAWIGYISDERKRRRESEALIAKYRDPLLLAAQDLQSRLHNVTDWNIHKYYAKDSREKENLLLYTAYVVGQYFSWTYILRRQLQFLRFSTEQVNKQLAKALANVVEEFSTSEQANEGAPFMLWRGDQMAIGEIMMEKDGDELFPMGYATFHKKWMDGVQPQPPSANDDPGAGSGLHPAAHRVEACDGEFRRWFRSIIHGVSQIAESKKTVHPLLGNDDGTGPDRRLKRLQHLLVDLIDILDPNRLRSEAQRVQLSHRASPCRCSSCKRNPHCLCQYCAQASKPVVISIPAVHG